MSPRWIQPWIQVKSSPTKSRPIKPRPITPARKYHIWTIGCQMNIADSNHVAAELEKIGYGPTDKLDDADVVVLNTCVVRQTAEEKAQGKLGSLKPWKRAKADRTIALMGCMVGVKPSPQLIASYPYVDVFMPPSEATPLVNRLRQDEIEAEMAAIEREHWCAATNCKMNNSQLAPSSQSSIWRSAAKRRWPRTCRLSMAVATPAPFV
ncbi:MAG: hypothetical protein R2867_38470 [Caldilineaceae bacterium]